MRLVGWHIVVGDWGFGFQVLDWSGSLAGPDWTASDLDVD